ncbi:hypothetical protein ACET3Z_010330 [Daucus carota]
MGHTYLHLDFRILVEFVIRCAKLSVIFVGRDKKISGLCISLPSLLKIWNMNKYNGVLVVGRQPQIERYWAGGLKISLPNSRARCWKTAIVEGTAQRIENGDVPEKLEVEKVFVCLIQGSSFGSGCLRCCTEDWIREFLSSLSKSEMHLEDSYNLACVLTLPPYQKKDYGKFLIAFWMLSTCNFPMKEETFAGHQVILREEVGTIGDEVLKANANLVKWMLLSLHGHGNIWVVTSLGRNRQSCCRSQRTIASLTIICNMQTSELFSTTKRLPSTFIH